ncbi:YoaK family protein [Pseudomonas huanghezhanensis]|uniref:YoaK family protein n=1 Tax=Pseudomonas huanghezhanensis TaxID=3002903 RepID=UPI0022863263|nr:YoaK family protein [Pseudomonas sp. BSw22131]
MLPTPVSRSNDLRFLRARVWRGRIGLGLVASLSVLAGMTDAIGFMATGDFVSFMSGNTTRLAVAISDGDSALIGRLCALVVAFIAGNALGVIVSRFSGRRAFALLLLLAAMLGLSASLPTAWQTAALLIGIIAMGMLNAVVEQVNGLPIGLTYVTGALSRFGRGLGRWLVGERPSGWRVQLVPWTGMFIGAVLGAVLEQRMGLSAMYFSAALAVVIGLVTLKIPRRWQLGYMPR